MQGELLNVTCAGNSDLISKFKAFEEDKEIYASYCFAKVPGNRGRHGSGACEQKHSNVLAFLNDREKGRNSFCQHPMVLIKELPERQAKHVRITNERLLNMSEEMKAERVKFASEPQTKGVLGLIKASKYLNKPIIERYKGFQKRALGELYLVREMHPDTKEICIIVKS